MFRGGRRVVGVGAAGLEGLGGRRWWVSKVHGVLRCTEGCGEGRCDRVQGPATCGGVG